MSPNRLKIKNLNHYPKPPCVYILYDSKGVCLYVGASKDYKRRINSHRSKEWGSSISKVELYWVWSDEESLFEMERQFISEKKPLFNVMSNSEYDEKICNDYVKIPIEVNKKIPADRPVYDPYQLALINFKSSTPIYTNIGHSFIRKNNSKIKPYTVQIKYYNIWGGLCNGRSRVFDNLEKAIEHRDKEIIEYESFCPDS